MTRPTSFTIILSALFCLSTLLLLFRAPTQSLAQISATNPWAAAPRRQDQPSQQTIPPAIVLTKTASLTMVTPGERVTYTIQVQNATTAALTIHLTDTLPIALHAVLMPPVTSTAPVQLGHLLTWTGIISQAQQVAIRYSAQVTTADVRQPITNQVVVQVNADQFFTTTASILTKRQLFMPLIQQARPPTPTPTATPPTVSFAFPQR